MTLSEKLKGKTRKMAQGGRVPAAQAGWGPTFSTRWKPGVVTGPSNTSSKGKNRCLSVIPGQAGLPFSGSARDPVSRKEDTGWLEPDLHPLPAMGTCLKHTHTHTHTCKRTCTQKERSTEVSPDKCGVDIFEQIPIVDPVLEYHLLCVLKECFHSQLLLK